MTDQTTAPKAAEPKDKNLYAVLVIGLSYTQIIPATTEGGRATEHAFIKGVPKLVTPAMKATLMERAIEEVTYKVGNQTQRDERQKFAFQDSPNMPDVQTRTRRRSA